jgi:hypothetical protein
VPTSTNTPPAHFLNTTVPTQTSTAEATGTTSPSAALVAATKHGRGGGDVYGLAAVQAVSQLPSTGSGGTALLASARGPRDRTRRPCTPS